MQAKLIPTLPPVVASKTRRMQVWAGAECTINRIGNRYIDQSALTGHYDREDDLDRFSALGVDALRYPLLWEALAQARDPARVWAWHDERLDRLRSLGVRPIIGLVHHGAGPASSDLLSPDFVSGLADHAQQVAQRYPWVCDWTPVNEPLTTARFSALYGYWYPHVRDERTFWHTLLTQIEATHAAMSEIRQIMPIARLIQTEDLGHTQATPPLQAQADHYNERRWATWDLLTGSLTPEHPLWQRLADFGLAPRLEMLASKPCVPDVLGVNHYLTSDRFLDHRLEFHPASSHGECALGPLVDTEAVRACDQHPGIEGALRACWDRYGIPVALTEVHNGCSREEQMRWLMEAWQIAGQLRDEGISIKAVTAWSLLGATDWDSLLTRNDNSYESGVFDVRSNPPRETALGTVIRSLANNGTYSHPVLSGLGWWHKQERASSRFQQSTKRPLLIIGASGTLGQAFAGACELRSIPYTLSAREFVDLTKPSSIDKILDAMQPWAVINTAGWVRVDEAESFPDECYAVNHLGAVALSRACAERDIHLTCFSSDLVFDGSIDRAYVESDPVAPLNVYGLSKASMEREIAEIDSRGLIVRTASFFSPYDTFNFAAHLVRALRQGAEFSAASDCVTTPTYVPDLVSTVLDLIIDDETGLWHLANNGSTSWAQFAFDLAKALNLSPRSIVSRSMTELGWLATRPRNAALSSERGLIMPTLTSAIDKFARELS